MLQSQTTQPLPPTIHVALERAEVLRYGENPHQQGARYRFAGAHGWWDSMVQHGGKELSYLNLYDTEAAWRLVNDFEDPACVIVKHANPCGVALADDVTDAYVRANACDPVSAFGGIVAVNRAVTPDMAEALAGVFTEVVVAPDYDEAALDALLAKKNMRVITANAPGEWPFDLKPIDGGFIIQQPDPVTIDRGGMARRDQGRTDRVAMGRPRLRLAGLCGGEQQRDRVRQGPSGVRDRCRPAEPARLGADRRRTISRHERGRGVRQRRLLPVPRRARRGCDPPASRP